MDFPFADQAFRSVCCKDYDACKSTDQQTVQFKRREKKKNKINANVFIVRQMKEKTSTCVDNVLLPDSN